MVVEHPAFNRGLDGASPSGPTKNLYPNSWCQPTDLGITTFELPCIVTAYASKVLILEDWFRLPAGQPSEFLSLSVSLNRTELRDKVVCMRFDSSLNMAFVNEIGFGGMA